MFIEILGGAVFLAIGKITYDKIQRDNRLRLAAAAEEEHQSLLEGVSATVFVREPNGARTNLEHHLEQELISRGARVLVANQQAGVALVKQGEFSHLHSEAHISVIGTLIVRKNVARDEKEWTESEHDFNVRLAAHRAEHTRWAINHTSYSPPEPQLRGRAWQLVKVETIHYQLIFRLIGRDGGLLASGTCEDFPRMEAASHESAFRKLAKDAIAYLDETDVWSRIAIV